MSEMVKRVAEAIEEADANGFSKLPYWACARAAIEAMREPTEAMIHAALVTPEEWSRAIDEALK